MKINPTPSCLSLVLHAIENAVLPDVTSQSARATLAIITATLTDLLKRQGPSAELVRSCNEKGRNLRDEARQLLEPAIPVTSSAPENGLSELAKGFDELSTEHDQLTRELNDLCVRLSSRCDQTTARFLQRVAEWELIYYEESQKMEVELFSNTKVLEDDIAALSNVKTPEIKARPLSRETLEEFLRTSRGTPLDVIEFSQMTGGYGKQTYQCSIKHKDRDEIEDLVIRKCDASPIIEAGGFRVEQEFELLRALATTDYPSPKPVELGHNIPRVDGSFYTMNRISGHVPSSFLGIMEMEFSEKLLLQLAELLGRLHSIPLSTFTNFIEKFEEPGALGLTIEERYRRNIHSWRQYVEKVEHLPSPYLTFLFHWLEQNIPSDTRSSVLTHGDFNFHNLLISGDKITGVLDWECSDFGAPEQDIVYVQQLVTKHMSWDKFLSHYAANGGMEIRPQNFAFCQAYSVLRTMIAFNRATLMNQVGSNRDIRFMMVTFGINAAFMGMGLAYTRMSDESESVEDAALESGEVHSQIAAEPVLKAVVSHVENTENSPKVAIVT